MLEKLKTMQQTLEIGFIWSMCYKRRKKLQKKINIDFILSQVQTGENCLRIAREEKQH